MTLKDFFDNVEEVFIGAVLQFPLYFIIGWWVIPVMLTCGLLWRGGGVTGGSKLFRRVGVPLVVCGVTFFFLHHWTIFLAGPFMVWLTPGSYGKTSWLYKFFGGDFLTRLFLFFWYWFSFALAYAIK